MKCSRPRCNREAEDAHYKMCERCREYDRKYYWNAPEKYHEKNVLFREKNPESSALRSKQWREENQDRYRGYYLEYNKSHRDEMLTYARDNPEKNRIRQHTRRAHIKGNGGTFTFKELNELFDQQEGFCFYCGELLYSSFDKDVHIEHKTPISRGGSNDISNIALSCSTCNWNKGTQTAEEFLQTRQLLILKKET